MSFALGSTPEQVVRYPVDPVAPAIVTGPPTLVDRLKAGDEEAFTEFVVTYQNRVFSVAFKLLRNRADAEDVAQEVFLRAFRGIGQFRGDAAIFSWLFTIAYRLSISHLLKEPQGRLVHEGDDPRLTNGSEAADDSRTAFERRDLKLAIQRAIKRLPEEHQIILVLKHSGAYTIQEIAELLAVPIGTVKSRLHRARMSLKDELKEFLS